MKLKDIYMFINIDDPIALYSSGGNVIYDITTLRESEIELSKYENNIVKRIMPNMFNNMPYLAILIEQ